MKFQEPGRDGVLFGFLFRLIGAIVAVVFSSLVMLLVGFFNGWVLTTPLLGLHFALIAIVVLLAEHFRSRAYERLVEDEAPSPIVEGVPSLPERPATSFKKQTEHRLIGRTVDIVGAAALLIVMVPVMVLIALLIKMDSSGPVLFRSTRMGKGGKQFALLKFRSMRVGISRRDPKSEQRHDAGMFPSDLRVTRVGTFLRQARLDELPVLLNVLMGDMTFVGPRPESPQFRNSLPEEIADRLTSVKPGLIGVAAVAYRSGTTDRQSELLLEIQFQERASAWQKFRLMARFVSATFREGGAI